MSQLIERIELFLEKKDHNPFKRKKKLGPGPRNGKNKQTGKYKCKCKDYYCVCKDEDGNEVGIDINKKYKKGYNKEYKAWGPQKKRRKEKNLP